MGDTKFSLSTAGPQIKDFLTRIIDLARLEVSFEITPGAHTHPDLEDPEIVVKFAGPDVDLLLANKAETLLALEHLTMEILRMPSETHSLLCFDANDYRLLRIEELRMSAVAAADRVKQTGKPFHFSPMTSRERRIIHLSLRNETEVKSLSTGTGSWRQVVIMPASMETIPEPVRPPMPPKPGSDGPRSGGRGGPGGFRGRPGDDRGGRPDRGRRKGPPPGRRYQ
ncbi:MAG TPA: R3H domain-containing nucleic acid-binding protein [Bryobacteraceae bacterium]|nr:R3H domain-containing nucleic acid-binding protein [Bryobacteraceae bacterium]